MIVVRGVCAVLAVVVLIAVAERLIPLRAVERDRWEWHYRPRGQFPGIDSFSRRQVALFGGVGLLLGYAVADISGALVAGVVVAAARWIVGTTGPWRLPRTLDNGTTRAMLAASSGLFDSESAANIYAAGWLRKARVRGRGVGAPRLLNLMLVRVRRRTYIPLLFLVTALLGVATVPVFGPYAAFSVLVGWTVLASAVWRATRLEVAGEWPWRWLILGVVVVVGVGVQWLQGVPDAPLATSLLAAVAIAVGAVLRGRPRVNDDFTVVESSVYGGIPAGMIGYWFSGWIALVPAALAVGLVP